VIAKSGSKDYLPDQRGACLLQQSSFPGAVRRLSLTPSLKTKRYYFAHNDLNDLPLDTHTCCSQFVFLSKILCDPCLSGLSSSSSCQALLSPKRRHSSPQVTRVPSPTSRFLHSRMTKRTCLFRAARMATQCCATGLAIGSARSLATRVLSGVQSSVRMSPEPLLAVLISPRPYTFRLYAKKKD
jgi:hypothetical protein